MDDARGGDARSLEANPPGGGLSQMAFQVRGRATRVLLELLPLQRGREGIDLDCILISKGCRIVIEC